MEKSFLHITLDTVLKLSFTDSVCTKRERERERSCRSTCVPSGETFETTAHIAMC